MYGLFIVIMVIIAILLILAVLVQRAKGGGFSSAVNANQFMGVQKSTDFIEKTTWTLAVILFSLCLLVGVWKKGSGGSSSEQKSKLDDVNKEAPVVPPQGPQAPQDQNNGQAQPQPQPQPQPDQQTNPDGTKK
jgi:preprotein translocase subunit SecG